MGEILLWLTSWREKWLQDSIRASRIHSLSFYVVVHLWELIASKLFDIHRVYVLIRWVVWLVTHWLTLLVESHDRCWFMLFPHHLDCFLSAIKVESVVLLLLLPITWHIGEAIILESRLLVPSSWLGLAYPRKIKIILFDWRKFAAWSLLVIWLLFGLTHAIQHQDEVSILIRSLLSLSFLDPAVQEVYSLLILLLEFCFDALILDVLESVHLELRHRCLLSLFIGVACRVLESVLGHLPLLSEFYIIFVKYYLLYIMGWHLSHEKRLHVALLEALEYLILKAKELQDLLEHCWSYRSFHIQALGHLRGSLLSVHLNALCSVSKLIKLSEDLLSLFLELSLENFHCLLVIQLFTSHNSWLVSEQAVNLVEKVLCRPLRVLEVHVNASLRKMTQH